MSSSTTNLNRIAKNTLFLYFRMILLALVSLYTSRVVLDVLGVDDYGIYNVVGGVVTLFTALSGTLASATTRFLTFEMGRGNDNRLNHVFSASVTIYVILAVIVVILAETVGLWFVNTQLVIPADRMTAANWCYQFSILAFCVKLISLPYNSALIANERMKAFAYISLVEGGGRLAIAFAIAFSPIDRLVFYALLILLLSLAIRSIYNIYCLRNFPECAYHFRFDRKVMKEMFGFASWNFIGWAAYIIREHGGAIIINMFCGPAVNAAHSLATKINTTVSGLIQNFMLALNPQITKSYSAGQREYMMQLIFLGARFSFYILLICSMPILLSTNQILSIWLKEVPEYTVIFVQLTLLQALVSSFSNPLIYAIYATGEVKKYQLTVGITELLNIPISYLALYLGAPPQVVLIVSIVLLHFGLAIRLLLLQKFIGLDVWSFIGRVYLNSLLVTSISYVPLYYFAGYLNDGIWKLIVVTALSVPVTGLAIYFVGCTSSDRLLLNKKAKTVLQKCLSKRKK